MILWRKRMPAREYKYTATSPNTSKFSREDELGRCNGGNHDPQ